MALPISVARFAIVWVVLATAMTINGICRELLLKRFLPVSAADAVSAAIGILLITVVAVIGFRPLAGGTASRAQRAALSASLVAATIVFETAVGLLVDRKTWSGLLEHYALWRGELWPLVLAWLGYTPFMIR